MDPPYIVVIIVLAWILPIIHVLVSQRKKPLTLGYGVLVFFTYFTLASLVGVVYTEIWQNRNSVPPHRRVATLDSRLVGNWTCSDAKVHVQFGADGWGSISDPGMKIDFKCKSSDSGITLSFVDEDQRWQDYSYTFRLSAGKLEFNKNLDPFECRFFKRGR